MTVRILALHRPHRWRDPLLLSFSDTVAHSFNSHIVVSAQVAVTVSSPRAWRVGGTVGRGTFVRRPLSLVLAPHPAGFLGGLVPLLRLRLLFGGVLPGRGGNG